MKVEVHEEIYRLMHPKLTFLLTSVDKAGTPNVMALAWATPLSEEPPLVGIAVGKDSLTAANIKSTGEFVLNVATTELAKATLLCGTRSGRKVDKFKSTNLTKQPAHRVNPPYIKECIGHIECKVKDVIDAGECYLFIGEILYACVDDTVFDEYWKDEANVLLHLGGSKFATMRSR